MVSDNGQFHRGRGHVSGNCQIVTLLCNWNQLQGDLVTIEWSVLTEAPKRWCQVYRNRRTHVMVAMPLAWPKKADRGHVIRVAGCWRGGRGIGQVHKDPKLGGVRFARCHLAYKGIDL